MAGPRNSFFMNNPKKFPLVPAAAITTILALASGVAAQLCCIGHGPILLLATLSPYAALLTLRGFEVLPVWVAVLQFPVYAAILAVCRARGALPVAGVTVLFLHCLSIVATATLLF